MKRAAPHTPRRPLATLASVTILVAALSHQAYGQCTYTPLASGVAQTATGAQPLYTYEQSTNFWSAVGVRSAPGDDWDVAIYSSSAAPPTCVGGVLAASTNVAGVDFVVGDYNHNPLGTTYVQATHFAGAQNGTIEWDDNANELTVNGAKLLQQTGPNDVLEMWDVQLEGGKTYTIEFQRFGADTKVLLFRNPGAGYWVSRGTRVLETASTATYTAPATDWYGVVVVNDDGGTGTYWLRIGTCLTPVALDPTTTAITLPGYAQYSFTQTFPYWTALATRRLGAGPGLGDWDVAAASGASGAAWPLCHSGQLASSNTGAVDFVVGDFNKNTPGTYYYIADLYSGTTAGLTKWDRGGQQLTVNGPMVNRTYDSGTVLEMWDVLCQSAAVYSVDFAGQPADPRLFLFANDAQGTYWTSRNGALLNQDASGATMSQFIATSSAFHGVAVVNEANTSGSYHVRIGSCTEPVQPLTSGVTAAVNPTYRRFSFTQQQHYWSAAGIRAATASAWHFWAFSNNNQQVAWPACGPSAGNGYLVEGTASRLNLPNQKAVDFVVGDFGHNPTGTFYLSCNESGANAVGTIEWDDGIDEIVVDGPIVSRNTSANDVLEVWDLFMRGGREYTIYFARPLLANTKLYLFRSLGGPYWGTRSSAALEVTTTYTQYTAPADDWYGVVVVNDNGQAGRYEVAVGTSVTGTEPGTMPVATSLTAVAPNPSPGDVTIEFALHEAASVAIDILDVAGRRVASLPVRQWNRGLWKMEWSPAAEGRRLAAGVYWARMSAAGREIERRKFVLVR